MSSCSLPCARARTSSRCTGSAARLSGRKDAWQQCGSANGFPGGVPAHHRARSGRCGAGKPGKCCLTFSGMHAIVAPVPGALSSAVERFVHTCAVRGVPIQAGKTGGTGDKVSKASPYLETKVEGDRSMVRKGGRSEVPESCPSANLYMAKPELVEPNQSDLARGPRHHGTIGRA
jgi:hypothetical protein